MGTKFRTETIDHQNIISSFMTCLVTYVQGIALAGNTAATASGDSLSRRPSSSSSSLVMCLIGGGVVGLAATAVSANAGFLLLKCQYISECIRHLIMHLTGCPPACLSYIHMPSLLLGVPVSQLSQQQVPWIFARCLLKRIPHISSLVHAE